MSLGVSPSCCITPPTALIFTRLRKSCGRPGELSPRVNIKRIDRHRGGGHPPTPATPPCVRVRTRRFELVALTPIDQRRKSKRFEVGVGKPHREGFGPSEVPRAASATSRVTSQSRTNPQFQQCRSATARCFPLPPQSCTQ